VVPQRALAEECHLSHPRTRRHTLAWIVGSPKPVSRRDGGYRGQYGCEDPTASVLISGPSAGARERPTASSPFVAGDTLCAGGGIGRRAGFRFQCPKGRGGSTPPSRTEDEPRRPSGLRGSFVFALRASLSPSGDAASLRVRSVRSLLGNGSVNQGSWACRPGRTPSGCGAEAGGEALAMGLGRGVSPGA
jgi:hypothetical protein